MRAVAVRTLVIGGVVGAIVGVLVALAGNWWASRQTFDLGYFSSSPRPDARSFHIETDWWSLIWPAALAGMVVGAVAALAFASRLRGGSPSRPWPLPLLPGIVGAVLGLTVAATLYLRSGPDQIVGAPRRYVDYLPTPGSAYSSSLTLTLDDPGNVWMFVVVCGITGLALGLVGGAMAAVRRRAR